MCRLCGNGEEDIFHIANKCELISTLCARMSIKDYINASVVEYSILAERFLSFKKIQETMNIEVE